MFQNDERKILFATMEMDNSCRQDWNRYVDDLPIPQEQQEASMTWPIFEDWTLTLITHTLQRKADIKRALESLKL